MTKARRSLGRSLLDGLTNSTAAVSRGSSSSKRTWTSTKSNGGKSSVAVSPGSGGVHTATASVSPAASRPAHDHSDTPNTGESPRRPKSSLTARVLLTAEFLVLVGLFGRTFYLGPRQSFSGPPAAVVEEVEILVASKDIDGGTFLG